MREPFLLDPAIVYLNHGSFGACPEPVFSVYQALQRELEREPVDFLARNLEDRLAQARERLGAQFGTSPDNLAFVSNVTTAINFLARSLPLEPDDEVLSTDHEYGAIDQTWRGWGRRLINHPLRLPVEDYVEELWEAVTPRTRVLCLSHISSPTGLVFPVQELVRRARERGIWTIIDGAHVPGQSPLDLERLGADFYAANLHKWMCAPKGSAFLYARPEVQSLVRPLVVSWPFQRSTPFLDAVMSQGTRDPAAYLATPAALEFCQRHHGPETLERCRGLAREGRRRLLEVVGTPALAGEDWLAQMAAVELPAGTDPQAMHAWLRRERQVEVPVWAWQGRPLLRISVQSYNHEGDLEALLAAVKEYLAH